MVKRKRSRIVEFSSDSAESDRENESDNGPGTKTMKRKSKKVTRPPSLDSPLATKKSKRDTDASKLSFEDKLAASIVDSGAQSAQIKDKQKEPELDDGNTVWLHNKLDFLRPENIRDVQKNKPTHVDYDPTTLYVPDSYLNKLTPVRINVELPLAAGVLCDLI